MLDMHVIQPVPPAMEPPVVARMAAQAGLGAGTVEPPKELSTGWKVALIGGSFLLMSLAYLNCVQRGACEGFWKSR
jgi:hypothetical protein